VCSVFRGDDDGNDGNDGSDGSDDGISDSRHSLR
jgi:hypothetical protein